MPTPLLTVVMPSFNAQRFIAESIESVIAQTLDDWELLVVDDASTDATRQIVGHYQQQDGRIRLLARPGNQGAAYARNFALDHACGQWIAFIDSDDVWHPQKNEKQLSEMQREGADISYTGYRRGRDGDLDGVVVQVPERVEYRTMLRRNLIACSTAMVSRKTCGSVRMPLIRRRQDHGYWLALLRDGTRTAVGVAEPLVWYRLHPESLSANKLIAAMYSWKLLREVERFSAGKSLWLFGGYAFEAMKLRTFSKRT